LTPAEFPVWTTLTLGFVLGLRHALDADHLAAVSTFVSEERNVLRSTLVGVSWGMGHTAALLVFGLGVAAFRLALTPRLSQFLEFLVGLMLIFLGGNVPCASTAAARCTRIATSTMASSTPTSTCTWVRKNISTSTARCAWAEGPSWWA
jgi:ABC-type nickel/cobalt efflux system permease component RcnA